jgi:hypothetical protein
MVYLAQPLTLQLQTACTGIYLRWLTPLGEWPGWLFQGDFDNKTDLADATDLATADARAQVAVRRAGLDTLTVRAGDLSTAQHRALSTILDSPQVYQQLADGSRLPVLVTASASATRTSSDGKHQLELDIRLPARNSLTH